MSFKRTVKRFAHVNGFTYVTYSEDGENIITCGSNDGDIRIWKEIDDDDPETFCVGETCVCIAQYVDKKKPRLIAATDNNSVQYFTYAGDRDGVLFRFSAPVTAIKINEKWIAAGSEDFTIKLQPRTTTDEYIELKGHEGPILHIDISSKDLLASSSGDGTIRIWSFSDKAATVVKKLDGFSKFNEFSAAKVYSTPSFNAQGNLLAYPKDKAVYVLDTTTWETKFKLENTEVIGKYSVCSFSHCEKFIAAGSLEGEICVWNVAEKSKLKGQYAGEDQHAITSISWNPVKSQGELAFCDTDGQLSTVKCSAKDKLNKIFEEDEAEEVADGPDDLYGEIEFREDEAPEDEENENCISLDKLKNETLNKNGDSDDDLDSVKSLPTSIVGFEHFPVPKPFPIQNPFQPGSTPIDLEHRFMVWNHVGQVVCHSADENSIITEFHDVTIHPSLHILNNLKHEMASLSKACLALATKETPCPLVCIAFISAGSKEWSTTMPECEEIQAVAAGDNFVAVATDARIIRFFTTMGTQREVVAVAGPVVALSASENNLAVAYHTSEVSNKFSLMIITLIGPTMTSRVIDLPLAANTKLAWLGFSDMGSVIAYDSSGRVTSYNIKRNLWFPICDMNEHVSGGSDNFFIVSVSERNQKIRATLCRGLNYPLTNPRPIVREVDYAIPLCYMETEKSKLEEALVRANTFNTDSSEKTIYEKGLKLFSSAMNSELESRAYEIVELIGDRRLTELAAKYASQKGRIHMANKISKLLVDIDEKERQKEALIEAFEADVEQFSETYEMETSKAADKRVQETSTPVIAPKPMISQKRSNPFKKSGAVKLTSTPTTALDHLTKKSISHKQPNSSDDENTPTNNISSSRPIGMDTPRPGNFGEWFIANKDVLSTSHPDASEVELMKAGKKMYMDLTKKQNSEDVVGSEPTNTSMMNKRKLNMSIEDSEGGVSKLAKFGFVQE